MIIEAIRSFLPKTYNDRQVRKLQLIADEIDALESEMESKSDEQLKAQTDILRKQVHEHIDYGLKYKDALELVLPEAFATVRETARRILGERHYNCQLLGGIAMFRGNVVEMKTGEVQTISLTEFMADKAPIWEKICEKHHLQKIPYTEITTWPFADYVFGTDWDVMTDTLKLRLHGFHDCLRSDEMFIRIFKEFRQQKVIP